MSKVAWVNKAAVASHTAAQANPNEMHRRKLWMSGSPRHASAVATQIRWVSAQARKHSNCCPFVACISDHRDITDLTSLPHSTWYGSNAVGSRSHALASGPPSGAFAAAPHSSCSSSRRCAFASRRLASPAYSTRASTRSQWARVSGLSESHGCAWRMAGRASGPAPHRAWRLCACAPTFDPSRAHRPVHPNAAPWIGRSRWPAWATSLRVCPRGCVRSLHARTLRPPCWGSCPP